MMQPIADLGHKPRRALALLWPHRTMPATGFAYKTSYHDPIIASFCNDFLGQLWWRRKRLAYYRSNPDIGTHTNAGTDTDASTDSGTDASADAIATAAATTTTKSAGLLSHLVNGTKLVDWYCR